MHRYAVLCAALVALVLGGLAAEPAGGQGATPAAGQVVDPSACRVEPRTAESLQQLAATPAAAQSTPGGTAASPTVFVMPEGQPADEATVAAITATYQELVACLNAGDYLRAYALYSDAYLRRNFGPEAIAAIAATPAPVEASRRVAFAGVREARVLQDGRVGAVVQVTGPDGGGGVAGFSVFARVGERWLVDEERVAEAGQGTPAA